MCVCDIQTLMASGCKCGDVATTINHDEVVTLVNKIVAFGEKLSKLSKAAYHYQLSIQELDDACDEYKAIEAMAGKEYRILLEGIDTRLSHVAGMMC